MSNLKKSTKMFVGVEEVSTPQWLEAESISAVSHQQHVWRRMGPPWEKQMAHV